MEYREIAPGVRAGAVGLGTEQLDGQPYERVKEVIDAAFERDMNCMDLFMPGAEVRENIGRALGRRRKDFIIQGHIGSTDVGQQYDISRDPPTCAKYFEQLLRALRTDYIDIGMCFFVDSDKDFRDVFDTGFIDYVLRLRREGKIRLIGASSHNPVTARRVVETGLVETLMFSVNPAFDSVPPAANVIGDFGEDFSGFGGKIGGINPVRAELYALCEARGVAVTTMKTLGAGLLISPERTPFSRPLTVGQCIHYALNRPAVKSALIGCRSRAEVEEAARYFSLSDEERDYTGVIASPQSDLTGRCVYCGHCAPCPSGIDVAAVHRYLDVARLTPGQVPAAAAAHYRALRHGGAACVECGSCESRCPFGVPVMEDMKEAARVFGA
ncbi:MAG: aldo/keto reductase [Firmicutes bacterium]|nr:aldo/keto reductase [Bacillota bacterium]